MLILWALAESKVSVVALTMKYSLSACGPHFTEVEHPWLKHLTYVTNYYLLFIK